MICGGRCPCGSPCVVDHDVDQMHGCSLHDSFHEGNFRTIDLVSSDDVLVAHGSLPPFSRDPPFVVFESTTFRLMQTTAPGHRAVYKQTFSVEIHEWKTRLDHMATPSGGRPYDRRQWGRRRSKDNKDRTSKPGMLFSTWKKLW